MDVIKYYSKKLVILLAIVFSQFSMIAQIFTNDEVKDNITIEYLVSKKSIQSSTYIDVLEHKEIEASKSAIVLIDLWNEQFLNPMIEEFINPLIDEASERGIHIIYAPSQFKQNRKLKISDNSITFYNLDTMDEYIYQNNIKNIFYVGFDALYCVIDKPNGIFSFRQRNKDNLSYFVFDKGVTSFTKDMKQVALSLFKKNNIGVIKTEDCNYENVYPTKTIEDPFKKTVKDSIKGNDFVIVFKNNQPDLKLINFIDDLECSNIDYADVIGDTLYYKDKKISNSYEFIQLLKKHKVNNIYYSGYHLDNEILWSKFGITNIYIKKRYYRIASLPKIYIVNDLAYVAEADPKKLNDSISLNKSVIINHYRDVKNILSHQLFNK